MVRISDKRDDDDWFHRQEPDCRALAERLGWDVAKVYVEAATSAYKRKRVIGPDGRSVLRTTRPGLREALDDLEAGVITGLLVPDLDRYARDPRDLEDLIDVAEATGHPVRAVTGNLRLDTDADVTNARIQVAINNKSSRDTARRVARAARQRAEDGRPHGGQVLFGLDTDEHAEWIREAVRRILNGETVYGICVDWNRKGRTTGKGSKGWWHVPTLQRILTNPGLIGMRRYKSEVFPSQHPGIVDREDWERVCAVVNDPSKPAKRGRPEKYTMSGLVFCALCENRMNTASERGVKSFECITQRGGCGRVSIGMETLEHYVTALFFASLDERRMADRATPPRDHREAELRTAIDRDRQALDSLAEEKDDGLINEGEYRKRRARITERLDRAEAQRAAILSRAARASLPGSNVLRKRWPDMDNEQRRTAFKTIIDKVMITTHPRGVATSLLRRKGEPDAAFAERREHHLAAVLAERVSIMWLE